MSLRRLGLDFVLFSSVLLSLPVLRSVHWLGLRLGRLRGRSDGPRP